MATYSFPNLMPASVDVTRIAAQMSNRSPFSFKQQVYDFGGRMLQITVTMQPMDATDAATFGAFLASLDGMVNSFTFNLDPWAPGMGYGTRTFQLSRPEFGWSTERPVSRYRFEATEVV